MENPRTQTPGPFLADERPLSVRRRRIEMPLPIVKRPAKVSEAYQGELNAQREADRVTVNQFAPPGVLITADFQIVQFRGPTGAYLARPRGKASVDVLKMAREGLMLPLRDAINRAKRRNTIAHKHHVRVQQNGKTRTVNIKVLPLKHVRERCFLILFEDAGLHPPRSGSLTQRHVGPSQRAMQHINELETDLAETRDHLQTIQQQYEAANEELQVSIEEVQFANEELQSVNEELGTSKEELETANEELTTVNEEMASRNVELTRLNSDLVNLQTSIKLAILLLGRDLTIRRFTPQAESLFNLLATDVGRPLGHVRHNLVFGKRRSQASPPLGPQRQARKPVRVGWQVERPEGLPPDLETMAAEVIASVREREHEVRDTKGRWYLLRARPYFTLNNKVDGVVLVLVDITERKDIENARARVAAIVESSEDAIVSEDLNGMINTWNEGAERLFGYTAQEAVGRSISILIPLEREEEKSHMPASIARGVAMRHSETVRRRKDGRLIDISLTVSPIKDAQGRIVGVSKIARDITERKQAEQALRASEEQFSAVFHQTTGGIAQTDVTGRFTLVNDRYCDLVGRSREELLTLRMHDITHPDDLSANAEQFHALVQGGPNFVVEKRYLCPDGSTVWVHNDVAALRDSHGRVSHVVAAVADITERKQAEAGNAMLASIVQSSDDAIISKDLNGVITSWNAAAERLFGYSAAEAVGQSITMLIPPDRLDEEQKIINRVKRDEQLYHFETKRLRKDGSMLDISLTISPLTDAGGRVMGASAIACDMTERKHLREKEVLLKEIHHRVKNNMQIVSSLFDLQSEHTQDRQALEIFQECGSRVRSMALIHERLYRSQDLARVNFTEYIRSLADDLYRVYKVSSDEIMLDVDMDMPPLSIDIAIPCGLLLNELLSNCLKHAFKEGEQGRILVSLYRGDDDTSILTVADDGAEFPQDLDFRHTTSFGMQLVNTMVEQLHGEITLTSNRGTAFTVTFPGNR